MDHGCPEMKCTYFHRNIVGKKNTQNDRSHAMDISRIIKVILKNYPPKNWKMSHLTVKKRNFQKNPESSISYGTRFSQSKYPIPR